MTELYAKANDLMMALDRYREIPENTYQDISTSIIRLIYQIPEPAEVAEALSQLTDLTIKFRGSNSLSKEVYEKILEDIKVCREKATLEASKNVNEINLLIRYAAEMDSISRDENSFTFMKRPEVILSTIVFVKDFLQTLRGNLYRDVLLEQTGNAMYACVLSRTVDNERVLNVYLQIGKELGFYSKETKDAYLKNCRNACPELFNVPLDDATSFFNSMGL